MLATAASVMLLATLLGSPPASAADPAPPGITVRSAPESPNAGSLTAKAARAAAEDDDPEGALPMPRRTRSSRS